MLNKNVIRWITDIYIKNIVSDLTAMDENKEK